MSSKIILAHLKIWRSKTQPFSGNLRPDLLTSLMNMSLVLHLPRKIHLADPLQMPHACQRFWNCYNTPSRFAHFWQGAESLAHATQNHILTSKSSPRPSVFYTVHFHNVLRATTVCTFSTSQLPKVLRTWCVFRILTSKCASCHDSVQFFIYHLPRRLRTLASLLFDSRGKTQWAATLLLFPAPASSVFWLFLFSDLLSSFLFSDSSHLCFCISAYCRKFDF